MDDELASQKLVVQQLLQEAANREAYELELANTEVEEVEKGVEEHTTKEEQENGKYHEPTKVNGRRRKKKQNNFFGTRRGCD